MASSFSKNSLVELPSRLGKQGWAASRKLKVGNAIAFLTGEIVDTKEMLRRVRNGERNVDDPMQISRDMYILLDEVSQRFSHSCDPNAGVRGSNTLFAIRDIARGEVISLDYSTLVGTSLFDQVWQMKCECGTSSCRNILGSVLSLPRDTLKRYLIAGALPDFIVATLISADSLPLIGGVSRDCQESCAQGHSD